MADEPLSRSLTYSCYFFLLVAVFNMTAPNTHQDLGIVQSINDQASPIRHIDDPENLQFHGMSICSGFMVKTSYIVAHVMGSQNAGLRQSFGRDEANQGHGFAS